MRLIAITTTLLFAILTHAQSYKELVNTGTIKLEKGEIETAIKYYNEALMLEPENSLNEYVYANLALAYLKDNNPVKAEETYTKALNLNPNNLKLLRQRGNLYLDMGKSNKAIEDYNNVISQKPYDEEALYYRAYIYAIEKEYDKAYDDYYKILAINPQNEKARFALALLLNKENKNEEALLLLDMLIENNPNVPDYYIACSEIEKKLKRYELALIHLENGVQKCEDNTKLYIEKARLLINMKRKKDAKKTLDELTRNGYYSAQMNTLYKECK